MWISPSSTIVLSCCYVLMVLLVASACAYDKSDGLTNSLTEQQFELNLPSYYDRFIRSTKFPRIGRSSSLDNEEGFSFDETNSSENNDDDDINNELRLIEQRSVLFPRIGKRAFHNLLWANSRSNPHRMIDSQGRYFLNGYDHHLRPKALQRYRGKRSVADNM